jgi:hypothetical protein
MVPLSSEQASLRQTPLDRSKNRLLVQPGANGDGGLVVSHVWMDVALAETCDLTGRLTAVAAGSGLNEPIALRRTNTILLLAPQGANRTIDQLSPS